MTTTLFGKQARIIVAGGRDFNNYILLSQTLDAVLKKYTFSEVQIVSGCCHGADALGEQYATATGRWRNTPRKVTGCSLHSGTGKAGERHR